MILSKANLLIQSIIGADRGELIAYKDGHTSAHNKKAQVFVGPVPQSVKKSVPLDDSEVEDDIGISTDTAKAVIKNISKDTRFGGLLEHCAVDVDDNSATFTTTDGVRRVPISGRVSGVKTDLSGVLISAVRNSTNGVCLNRKRLMALLNVMDKCCTDTSGESPVWVSFTKDNDVILRGVDFKTDQRVIARMVSYKDEEGKWIQDSDWEKQYKRKAVKRNNI